MHLQLGELSYVVISSAEAAKAVMKDHDLSFASRPYLMASKVVFYGAKDIALAPYGAHWRQMGKICVLKLLSSRRVLSFRPMRETAATKMVATVSRSVGQSVDLGRLLSATTSGLTYRIAFGMEKDVKESVFSKLIVDVTDVVGGFGLSDLFPSLKFLPVLTGFRSRLNKLHLAVDAMLQEIIDAHKGRRLSSSSSSAATKATTTTVLAADDLVDILLNLQDQELDDMEIPLTMDTIKAVILDVFLGSTETTSATVEWAMAELMRNPRAMQRAREEVRQIRELDEQSLAGLEYLDLVIQETLRLHPPFPLLLPREARESVEDVVGYHVGSNTNVIVNAWAIGRDPRYWNEAEEFRPERFLNRDRHGAADFDYFPCGGGWRMCPGISFGMAVVKLLLSNLIYHFDWKLPARIEPGDIDMTDTFGASIRRKHSLCLIPSSYRAMMP